MIWILHIIVSLYYTPYVFCILVVLKLMACQEERGGRRVEKDEGGSRRGKEDKEGRRGGREGREKKKKKKRGGGEMGPYELD